MDELSKIVTLWDRRNDVQTSATLFVKRLELNMISLSMLGAHQLSAVGTDVFEALKKIRAELEAHDTFILCNASRKDVRPSAMARQMGHAQKLYEVKIGQQAALSDLVNIWAPIQPQEVATVLEQELYLEEWVNALIALEPVPTSEEQ